MKTAYRAMPRRYWLCLAAVVLFLWFAFYPGGMSNDSFRQLAQARSFTFDTHHPTPMAALWSMLLPFADGPQPFLLLQILAYVGGFGLIAARLYQDGAKRWAVGVLLAMALPFFVNFSGAIWKDAHNALTWFVVSAIILYQPRFARRHVVFLLILLWYGWAVRGNALVAVLPILFLLFWRFDWGWVRTVAATGLSFVLFLVAQSALDRFVLEPTEIDTLSFTLTHDIAGIRYFGGTPALPATLRADNPKLSTLLDAYRFDHVRPLFWGHPDGGVVLRRTEAAATKELRTAWRRSIADNPAEYIRHRLAFTKAFLHWGDQEGYYVVLVPNEAKSESRGIPTSHIGPSTVLRKWVSAWRTLPVMKGWFWFGALVFLFILGAWQWWKTRRLSTLAATLLSMSGLLHLGPHFVFGQAPDFRYYYWAIFAAFLSLTALTVARRFDPVVHSAADARALADRDLALETAGLS